MDKDGDNIAANGHHLKHYKLSDDACIIFEDTLH